jgi:hypothetical protein
MLLQLDSCMPYVLQLHAMASKRKKVPPLRVGGVLRLQGDVHRHGQQVLQDQRGVDGKLPACRSPKFRGGGGGQISTSSANTRNVLRARDTAQIL